MQKKTEFLLSRIWKVLRILAVAVRAHRAPGLTSLPADGFRGDAAVSGPIVDVAVVLFWWNHGLVWERVDRAN